MRTPYHALFFLTLSVLASFIAPIAAIGGALGSLVLLSWVPGAEAVAASGIGAIVGFLATFGSGCPIGGLLVICLTWAFVGGIFQIYNHHRYQH